MFEDFGGGPISLLGESIYATCTIKFRSDLYWLV